MSTAAVAEKPLVGTVDIVLLASFIGVLLYWFCGRKKKTETAALTQKLVLAPTTKISQDDTSFIGKMKKSGKSLAIFYGSQTGTAEEFAGRLSKDASRYGLKAIVLDPEECDMEELARMGEIENSMAIFVVATYGEGDPTDNAQEFYEWLQNDRDDLDCLSYAGPKMLYFANFNKQILSGLEEDFVRWREAFWPAVLSKYNIDVREIKRRLSSCIDRQFRLEVLKDLPEDKIYTGEMNKLKSYITQRPPFDAKNPFMAKVLVNRELHKAGERSCMHIELDITGSKIKYDAGDHVAVYPMNDPELVEKLGSLLNVDLDTVISLNNTDEDSPKKHPFPCPTTYRTALLHYVDIASVVKTHVLRELAEYAKDFEHKEFLTNITDTTEEAKKQYQDWVLTPHRHVVAVLEDLSSLKPPLDHLLELLPRLQCRYYSISSSPKMYPTSIHITAVLVRWNTSSGRVQKGVATNWLATKKPQELENACVPIFVRKTQFRLPFKSVTPVVMVGPGTGFAPFRGFIQDRHVQKQNGSGKLFSPGKKIGDMELFFGCRKKSEDYIYEDELSSYTQDGTISKLHVAFSRDQEKKVYVTNQMTENKENIWNILNSGGHIYVCGDARNMARDVHNILLTIVKENGGMSENEAADYVKKLSAKGRYSVDVWS
ncbi:NADPH--cytochrome P450 reductase [Stylophora pistillata]|uniref:NADPH--hemoprotein reductase n=1 Tax=Stylophora pistillata TaxID=50429 RepID=A0A2B4S487_STYPI|nr:NADPH--cytochrome P450 reductase [Stylophora pistillata]